MSCRLKRQKACFSLFLLNVLLLYLKLISVLHGFLLLKSVVSNAQTAKSKQRVEFFPVAFINTCVLVGVDTLKAIFNWALTDL